MPVAAANANQQLAALQKAIAARKADGKVTAKEANELLAQAKKEFVQGGELSLLRQLAGDKALAPTAKDAFVKKVDQLVPAGAPTAQLAAILFRLDPKTGREQLLSILDKTKKPVAGGPKTFVVTGLGRPYLAAITSAAGHIYSAAFDAFRAEVAKVEHKTTVTAHDLAHLETLATHDGLLTPGEKGLLARVKKRVA